MTGRHLERPGHECLGDGSVLRLDRELGRWTATWYRPDMSLMAYAWGPEAQMKSCVCAWAEAFEASLSSPVAGTGDTAAVSDLPGGGLLGGVA